MKKKLLLLLVAIAGCCAPSTAQGRKALRINEVMVDNETNVVDDYSEHGAWIELFNSSYAPLEISSVYLTNDPSRPTLYPVPLGDVNTRIPKRQHIIFWADNKPPAAHSTPISPWLPSAPTGLASTTPTAARSSTR